MTAPWGVGRWVGRWVGRGSDLKGKKVLRSVSNQSSGAV